MQHCMVCPTAAVWLVQVRQLHENVRVQKSDYKGSEDLHELNTFLIKRNTEIQKN